MHLNILLTESLPQNKFRKKSIFFYDNKSGNKKIEFHNTYARIMNKLILLGNKSEYDTLYLIRLQLHFISQQETELIFFRALLAHVAFVN